MILANLTKAVREQNYYAVVLEFLIVIAGVVIGFQITAWNERLSDLDCADSYLDRLSQEMAINRETLSDRQDSYVSQIEYGLLALEGELEPTDREAAWDIIHSYFQASHAFTIALKRGTYDEIISSGDLALLDNQDLVNGLSDFYTFGGLSTIGVIPDYRENIRRIIPFGMQRYLQSECYEIIEPDTHLLLDCPPPEGFENLIDLARELQADSELNRDLRYMLSVAGVSSDIARNRMNKADDLLVLLSDLAH